MKIASQETDFLEYLKRENERLRKALEINRLISGELHLKPLLRQIMKVTELLMNAESCSLFLLEKDTGDLVFHATTGENEEQLKEVCRLKMGCGIAGWCARHLKTVRISDVYSDDRFNPEFDRKTNFTTRNMICVPLLAHGELIGVSEVINCLHGEFTEADEKLMESMMQMASIAIDNARTHEQLIQKELFQHDLQLAKSIQDSFLPDVIPINSGFSAATHIKPAFEVGGDFFDAVRLSDKRIAYLLGDISGKGVSAAMLMSSVIHEMRYEMNLGGSAGEILSRYNASLCRTTSNGMFATMVLLILDPKSSQLEIANAGHMPPLHLRNRQVWQENRALGPPIGIISDIRYDCDTLLLKPGETLLLYSDGVTDACNEQREMLGMERLQSWFVAAPDNARACVDYLSNALGNFVGNAPQSDDITLMALAHHR
jgi:sigma-B regulation protein RsbU (phosphoserine phosphatase)